MMTHIRDIKKGILRDILESLRNKGDMILIKFNGYWYFFDSVFGNIYIYSTEEYNDAMDVIEAHRCPNCGLFHFASVFVHDFDTGESFKIYTF